MPTLYTATVTEAESLDLPRNGVWQREYITGVGTAMHKSPKRALELARERMGKSLARQSAERWNGIGGCCFYSVKSLTLNGKELLDLPRRYW